MTRVTEHTILKVADGKYVRIRTTDDDRWNLWTLYFRWPNGDERYLGAHANGRDEIAIAKECERERTGRW